MPPPPHSVPTVCTRHHHVRASRSDKRVEVVAARGGASFEALASVGVLELTIPLWPVAQLPQPSAAAVNDGLIPSAVMVAGRPLHGTRSSATTRARRGTASPALDETPATSRPRDGRFGDASPREDTVPTAAADAGLTGPLSGGTGPCGSFRLTIKLHAPLRDPLVRTVETRRPIVTGWAVLPPAALLPQEATTLEYNRQNTKAAPAAPTTASTVQSAQSRTPAPSSQAPSGTAATAAGESKATATTGPPAADAAKSLAQCVRDVLGPVTGVEAIAAARAEALSLSMPFDPVDAVRDANLYGSVEVGACVSISCMTDTPPGSPQQWITRARNHPLFIWQVINAELERLSSTSGESSESDAVDARRGMLTDRREALEFAVTSHQLGFDDYVALMKAALRRDTELCRLFKTTDPCIGPVGADAAAAAAAAALERAKATSLIIKEFEASSA